MIGISHVLPQGVLNPLEVGAKGVAQRTFIGYSHRENNWKPVLFSPVVSKAYLLLHHLAFDRVFREEDDEELGPLDAAFDLLAPCDSYWDVDVDKYFLPRAAQTLAKESRKPRILLCLSTIRNEEAPAANCGDGRLWRLFSQRKAFLKKL